MSGSQKSQEVAVVLVCEKDVFIAVPQSLLVKESAVFKAKLSSNWQSGESEDSGELTDVEESGQPDKKGYNYKRYLKANSQF